MRVQMENVRLVMDALGELYPQAGPELHFSNPFETLIATILSAQCTDKRVNLVTARLFPLYPDAKSMARLSQEELENLIRDCGLYHNKAKNILAACRVLVEKYDGEVPSTRAELEALPGVGRKSANLIMGDVFGKPAIVTDTHCIRLCNRIGLVDNIKEPKKVEMELWKIVPPEEGNGLCHRFVDHGRAICTARTHPYCDRCVLEDICAKNI